MYVHTCAMLGGVSRRQGDRRSCSVADAADYYLRSLSVSKKGILSAGGGLWYAELLHGRVLTCLARVRVELGIHGWVASRLFGLRVMTANILVTDADRVVSFRLSAIYRKKK